MKDTMTNLELKQFIRDNGLTVEQFAEIIGASKWTVYSWTRKSDPVRIPQSVVMLIQRGCLNDKT